MKKSMILSNLSSPKLKLIFRYLSIVLMIQPTLVMDVFSTCVGHRTTLLTLVSFELSFPSMDPPRPPFLCTSQCPRENCLILRLVQSLGRLQCNVSFLFSEARSYRSNSKQVVTPIFTPTFNRQAHALLNLHHAFVGAQHVHILVMNASQVANYQKVWPNHIILILPDGDKSQGYGPTLYWIKLFAAHNYALNCAAMTDQFPSKTDPLTVWPWIIIMNDSCVMWKKSIVEPNGTKR